VYYTIRSVLFNVFINVIFYKNFINFVSSHLNVIKYMIFNIKIYILFYFFREKLLNNVEEEENYNLLEDVYETLNYDCGKIIQSLISK